MKLHLINKKIIRSRVIEYTATLVDDICNQQNYKIRFRLYGELKNHHSIILINHPLSYGINIFTEEQEKGWWDKFCRNLFRDKLEHSLFISVSLHTILDNLNEKFSITNFSRIQYAILNYLGIKSIDYVIGGSLGGICTADLICTYPRLAKNAIIINAAHMSYANHLLLRKIQEHIISNDANADEDLPVVAKLAALLLYKSPQYFDRYLEDTSCIDQIIRNKATMMSKHSWLIIKSMLDNYDLSNAIKKIESNVMLVGCSSDHYYPPYQQKAFYQLLCQHHKSAKLLIINSNNGHDAFLSDQILFANEILRNSIL